MKTSPNLIAIVLVLLGSTTFAPPNHGANPPLQLS